MSTLTKILIVIIFIMSLIYLGVTATLFSARIDYKNKFESEQKQHEEDKKKDEKEIGRLEGVVNTKNIKINELESKLDLTYNELTQTYSAKIDLDKRFTDLLNDFNRLQVQWEELTNNLNEQIRKSSELQTLLDEHRKRKEESEKDRDIIQARLIETEDKLVKAEKNLLELENQYVKMAKDLNYAQTELAFYRKRVPLLKPIGPVEPIDGKVLAVSDKYDLVVISVGKKDKVEVGTEFTVYRADKFIGKIRVEKVDYEWSSAMSLKEFMADRVQVGDNISTQVY